MATKSKWITHLFNGGWATDFGQTIYNPPDQNLQLPIPFLVDALNIVYEFDGGLRKAPGNTEFNATSVGSTTAVLGLFDYWRQGTSDAATQRIVIHAGTTVQSSTLSGASFSSIQTGLESGVIPQYSTFDDLLIYASTSTTDVPRSWDQTTNQNLAGTPPNFSFSVPHQNHQFAAGVFSTPSRLYYSAFLDPEDWTTATDAGSIDIDPNDGDHITGIVSHKNELWVFKGPYTGSIHRITGTNDATWARTTFIRGLGAGWIHTIFKFGDDLGFMAPNGSVYSLAATAAFGDFSQASLSYPIDSYLRTNLVHNRIRFFWAVDDPSNGRVFIGLTRSGATTNDAILSMDYRFLAQGDRYPRWSLLDSFSFASLGLFNDTSSRKRVWAGDYVGKVQRLDQVNRNNNGSSISFIATLPYITYGTEVIMKNLGPSALGVVPKNNNNITLQWQRDGEIAQSQTQTQGGTALLDSFTLDTDSLGSGRFRPRFFEIEDGGEFRSVQYQITDNTTDSDLEIHSLVTKLEVVGESTEN